MLKYLFAALLGIAAMALAPLAANATVIVTLTDGGAGTTTVSITGTGTTDDAFAGTTLFFNIEDAPLFGDYINNAGLQDVTFDIADVGFIGTSMLTSIFIDDDGSSSDDWQFIVSGNWSAGQAYDLNITFDIATAFSNFNLGVYTDVSDPNDADLGGFELHVIPEPNTLGLFAIGLAGFGVIMRRRRRREHAA